MLVMTQPEIKGNDANGLRGSAPDVALEKRYSTA